MSSPGTRTSGTEKASGGIASGPTDSKSGSLVDGIIKWVGGYFFKNWNIVNSDELPSLHE